MKQNELTEIQNKEQMLAGGHRPTAAEDSSNDKMHSPSSAEVANRAYFNWVNQGSPAGHDVQHWLDAEKELMAENNPKFCNGLQNREQMLAGGCRRTAADELAKK